MIKESVSLGLLKEMRSASEIKESESYKFVKKLY